MLSTGIYKPELKTNGNERRRRRFVDLNIESDELKHTTGENLTEHWEYHLTNMKYFGPAKCANIEPISGFHDCGLDEQLIKNARSIFQELSPLQRYTIPIILSNTGHVLVKAQTGSGKTASFALPAIQTVINAHRNEGKNDSPLVIILTNTCNLALQTFKHCSKFAGFNQATHESNVQCSVSVLTSGAAAKMAGQKTITSDIVIATMGSLLKELSEQRLSLNKLKLLILDEADKMMENSAFGQDVITMYESYIPEMTQKNLLVGMFSATYENDNGQMIFNNVMNIVFRKETDINIVMVPSMKGFIDQRIIQIKMSDRMTFVNSTIRRMNCCILQKKLSWLTALLDADLREQNTSKQGPYEKLTFIFVGKKMMCNYLASYLSVKGYNFCPYNSDFDLTYTNEVDKKIRNKSVHGIVATNKVARGADLPFVAHVIIFDMDPDFSVYEHRIGRTGRAGHKGTSTILFDTTQDFKLTPQIYEFFLEHGQMIPSWLQCSAFETLRQAKSFYQTDFGDDTELQDDDDDDDYGVCEYIQE